jgi:hypothetical protein
MKGIRLAVVKSSGATTVAPSRSGLSRYPTRTAPADPGHAYTRVRQLSAVRSLPGAMDELLARIGVDAVGDRAGPCPEGAAGQVVGGRGQWRR